MTTSGNQYSFDDVRNWEIPPVRGNAVEVGALPSPIWTETKARLIQNYLRLFLYITRHGVYVDGFAGPQDKNNPESWAAKLVLELSPPWLKSFFLCEANRSSYRMLKEMSLSKSISKGRSISVKHGDFNNWKNTVLSSGVITDNTATFALLDQQSIECHWSTVEALARHKRGDTKIELFYFFPTGWVHRTINATRDKSVLDAWWGDETWRSIKNESQNAAAFKMVEKILQLGYRDVKYWPICSRAHGKGRTMYHMIHATDHLEAPKLMYRAYKNLIGDVPADLQIQTAFSFSFNDHQANS